MNTSKTHKRPSKRAHSTSINETSLTLSASSKPKPKKPKPPLSSDNVLEVYFNDGKTHGRRDPANRDAAGDCDQKVSDMCDAAKRVALDTHKANTTRKGMRAKRAARAAAKSLRSQRSQVRKTGAAPSGARKITTSSELKPARKRPKPTKTTITTITTQMKKAVDETLAISHRAATKMNTTKSPETTKTTKKKKAVWHGARVPMPNGTTLKVSGVSTKDEPKFILVEQGPRQVLTLLSAWKQSAGEAINLLAANGITIIGSSAPVRDAVAQLRRFARCSVAIQSGWMPDDGFALADGRVIMPDGVPQPLKAFSPAYGMLDQQGSLDAWKQGVAAPLAHHMLCCFGMMTMFAAPLLRLTDRADNFGFELAGPAGRGKTTIQQLMASAAGRAIGGDGETYGKTCNATMNALEEVMMLISTES